MALFKTLLSFLILGIFIVVESKFHVKNSADARIEQITGGSLASIERFPYLAFISFGNSLCGGSIISKNHILTAAHCVCRTNKLIYVHTGSEKRNSGGTWTEANRVICHERYDKTGLGENDVAILVIGTKFSLRFDRKTQSIPLTDHEPKTGNWGYVSGWGRLDNDGNNKPEEMRIAAIEVLDQNKCRAGFWMYATSGSLCAGTKDGRDSCYGDSGGPFAIDRKLAGIVSAGPSKCGTKGLYMSVAYYREWIERKMAEPIPEGEESGMLTKLWDKIKG